MRPRWKVCGVTDIGIGEAAVEAGADAIGFVFYPPSPRDVQLATAAAIARDLPRETWRIGVFVDASREELERAIDTVGLDFVQLHGDEPASLAEGLSRHAFKALRLAADATPNEARSAAAAYPNCTLLVDTASSQSYGGTGQPTSWTAAAALAQEHRLMLAGGLTADNVADAIEAVDPWAIDVSSGLERAPGEKDPVLIREFGAALEELR